MIKKELAKAVSDSTGISHRTVAAVLNSAFECIAASLESGESVRIAGFGTFGTIVRATRKSNLTSGGVIPECKIPIFKPSDALKCRVIQSGGD